MKSSQNKTRTWLTVASAILATTNISAKEKPLNIIYIMSDDHTEQMIGAYNGKSGYTPHIDRIASEGVKFSQSFVANSISGPSRACLLTGKHSHKNGKTDNQVHFDGSQQTTPKILKANGYQTALVGKWHLESNPTGFDYWEILPGQGHYYQPEFITAHGQHTKQGYITDIITDKSIKWLSNRDKTKPFALFVHHKATHRNWMPKIEDLQAYEKQTFTIPAIFFDTYDGGLAASTAEMCIDKHMHWGYDLKASDPVSGKNYITDAINSSDKKKHCRTNAAARTKSRTAILRFHSKRLSKPPFKRSRTCRMEVSALYERLFENSQSARRQHRAIVFVPRKKMIGSKIR